MTTAAPAQSATRERSRGRSALVVVMILVAALLTSPALVGFWGQRTLNNTSRYVDTVGPLVDYPEVQAAVSTKVTDAIEKQVDVEALLNQAFAGVITDRPRLQLLVGPITGAVNGLIESQVRSFVASDAFDDLWVAANTRSQQALLKVLRGDDTGAVSVQNDEVVLDVSSVIDEVKARLVARGLTFLDRVPSVAQDRQIVLLQAKELRQAQTIYAFGNPVARWAIWVVVVLYLGAILLSRRRSRTTAVVGVLVAANALLIALLLSVGRQLFVNQLTGTVFGPASRVFYNVLLAYLERAGQTLLLLGLVLVAIGWFTGRNASGTAVRGFVSGGLESGGQALPDGPVAGAGRWVRANAGWLRVAIGALGLVVLLWGEYLDRTKLLWTLALVIVLLAAVQVLVGAGSRAMPVDPPEDHDVLPQGAPPA